MKTLNIIGCGTVGKTLARLFLEHKVFEIGDIVNRSLASGRAAADFIGAGRPITQISEMRPADIYLIATADNGIAEAAAALAASGLIRPGALAWHPSGALPSSVLAPVAERGAAVASVHPVQSFADPLESVGSFAGTWCGIEGETAAVGLLTDAFNAIGGRIFSVDPRFKTVYHAGSVLVCNYLTALMEVGARTYQKGGLDRETALSVMEPLVRVTVDNIFRVGTARALTGPIARGDCATVSAQLEALDGWDGDVATIYRALGRIALDLSRRRGVASGNDLARLREMLQG